MKRQALKIELLDDCVFSATPATEGGHKSLDRIPGAALLGAAAGRLYTALGQHDTFTVFHSGKVRIGDSLPWDGCSIGWPVPRCWHFPKTRGADEGGFLAAERLYNFALENKPSLPDNEQPKQLRDGYVHADGRYSKLAHSLRLKTAIDPATGRADEGRLFGYDALHRGQTFLSVIEADDTVEDRLFERLVETLTGDVLLGRSRSAEYGRARVTVVDLPEMPKPGKAGDSLTLWLLSDLALTDAWGQPTLQPDGEALGLPGAQVVWDRTFLRSRRYSPWNAARHGYDRERLVLEAGGVITLRLNDHNRGKAIGALENGIGLYREAGLGRLWIDPPLLQSVHPAFAGRSAATPETTPAPEPNHPLVGWLKAAAGISWKQKAEEWAREFEKVYLQKLDESRRLNGIPGGVAYGPSSSQWSTVLETARSATGDALHRALFEGDDAVIKATGEGWNIEVKEEREYLPLARWLERHFADRKNAAPKSYAHFVRLLARRIQDHIDNRRV